MNRTILATVCALLACGCSEPPTGPYSDAVGAPRLSASKDLVLDIRVPLSVSPFVECTGEVADLDGYQDVSVWQNTSASGRTTYRLKVLVHLDGAGRTTGASYRTNEITTLTGHYEGPSTVESFATRVLWIAKGRSANTAGWIRSHLTINATGEVTVDHVGSSGDESAFFECRGRPRP